MDAYVPESFTLCIAQTRRRFALRQQEDGRWLVRSSFTIPHGAATIRSERFADESHARDAFLVELVTNGTADCDALLDRLAQLRTNVLNRRPGFRYSPRALVDLLVAGAIGYANVAIAYAAAIQALRSFPHPPPQWLVCALKDIDEGRSGDQVGRYIAAELLR